MFRGYLQNELMALAAEAKKKPQIKQSCERVLSQLKQEQEIDLEPFSLAIESGNPKMVSISLGCIQKLVAHQSIPMGTCEEIMKMIFHQSVNSLDLQLKTLQIILPLVTNYTEIRGKLLSNALLYCYSLENSKNPVLSNTAKATFGQILLCSFERLGSLKNEPDVQQDLGADQASKVIELHTDCRNLFMDIGMLSCGEKGEFLLINSMPKSTSLELLESIIHTYPNIFKKYEDIFEILRDKICPMVIKSFSDQLEFAKFVRLAKLVICLVTNFAAKLSTECEIMLTQFSRILESSSYPNWQRILVLESYHRLISELKLQQTIFQVYDSDPNSPNLYLEIVISLTNVIFTSHKLLMFQKEDEFAISVEISDIRIPCISQLEKTDPPLYPDTYPILVAMKAILSVVEFLFQTTQSFENDPKSFELISLMISKFGERIFYTISLLLVSGIETALFKQFLNALREFTVVLGLIQSPLADSVFLVLCSVSTTCCLPFTVDFLNLPPVNTLEIISNSLSTLSDRNLSVISTLLIVSSALGSNMNPNRWFSLLQALQTISGILTPTSPNSAKQPSSNSSNEPVSSKTTTFLRRYSAKSEYDESFEESLQFYNDRFTEIFQNSTQFSDKSLSDLLKSLCRLAQENLHSSNMKYLENNFAISQLLKTAVLNISRIIGNEGLVDFDLITTQLINIAHDPICTPSIRIEVISAYRDILVAASQNPKFTESAIQLHFVSTIHQLMALDSTHGSVDPGVKNFLPKVRILAIGVIESLIQTSGQNMNASWFPIIEILHEALKANASASGILPNAHSPDGSGVKVENTNRAGFSCIALIASDFLSSLNPKALSKFIETVSDFVSLTNDLNNALISIGQLWTIFDYIITLKQKLQILPKNETEINNIELDGGSVHTLDSIDALWLFLLRSLSRLCQDQRIEVRNSSRQTMYRTININGEKLSLDSWMLCLSEILFPLLENLTNIQVGAVDEWNDGKVQMLTDLSSMMIDFLPKLSGLNELLPVYWSRMLTVVRSLIGDKSQNTVKGALKIFKNISTRSKSFWSDPSQQDLIPKLKPLFSDLFTCWLDIGNDLLNTSEEKTIDPSQLSYHPIVFFSVGEAAYLYTGPLSQDVIHIFLMTIFEVFEFVKADCDLKVFENIIDTIMGLTRYHTISQSTAESKNVDISKMTKVQEIIFDFLTLSKTTGLIELNVQIIRVLAKLSMFPFIPFVAKLSMDSEILNHPVYQKENCNKFSYISLAITALGKINELIQELESKLYLYNSGVMKFVLKSLTLPLKYRYCCPDIDSSNEITLWRSSNILLIYLIKELLSDLSNKNLIGEVAINTDAGIDFDVLFAVAVEVASHDLLFDWNAGNNLIADKIQEDEKYDIELFNFVCSEMLLTFACNQQFFKHITTVIALIIDIIEDDRRHSGVDVDFGTTAKNQNISPAAQFSPDLKPRTESLNENMVEIDIFDSSAPMRPKLITEARNYLFQICSRTAAASRVENVTIGKIAVPFLIEYCRRKLKNYCRDRRASGRFPLSKSKSQEILIILESLKTLKLNPADPQTISGLVTIETVRDYLNGSDSAHLFQLFNTFCEILEVVTGSNFVENTEGGNPLMFVDEMMVVDLTNQCLSRIGQIFEEKS